MNHKASLLLAALLACAVLPGAALAADAPESAHVLYPVEVVEYTEGDRPRLEKTYILTAGEDPAAIPTADFEREGRTYTLLDLPRRDQTESDAKLHTEAVAVESKSKDMDKILPLLPTTREVTTEDGYTGVLTLDTASVQVEAAGYSTSTRAVTAARTYPNLSDADVSLIPKSIEDGGRTLELANVQWQEAGEFYTANATYTGTASSKYATGYTVTAEYSGEVSKTTNDTVTYAALFSANPTQMQTAAKSGMNWRWLLVLPAGAAAAGLFFGGKFLLKKHKSKKNWEEYTK